MKYLLLILTISSVSVYAKSIKWEKPKCYRSACVVDQDYEYGFREIEDDEGNVLLELNTNSSLLDLPFDGMCFKGELDEVLKVIEGLADNANNYYYQEGGHFAVAGMYIKTFQENEIKMEVTIKSDYHGDFLRENLVVTKCE